MSQPAPGEPRGLRRLFVRDGRLRSGWRLLVYVVLLVVCSIIVGLLVEVSTLWLPSDLKYVGALVVLILILLVRPQGILGRKERLG